MDIAECGCPMDLEFVYHGEKCINYLSKLSRIGISSPYCPSCVSAFARIKELECQKNALQQVNAEAEEKLIGDRGCEVCAGGCPDKDHHVTHRLCDECWDHAHIRTIRYMQASLAAKEGAICRAREALGQLKSGRNDIEDLRAVNALSAALSSSSPCPHESEAKRLREALEWACNTDFAKENIWTWKEYAAELRRRAKEG